MDESCRALFFDLSGVLYEGSQAIPGATEAIATARDKGFTLRFVTNTATKSSQQILSDLRTMNIHVPEHELFTAPIAAAAYIAARDLSPYCLLHESIRASFSKFESDSPDCVVLGDARDALNYENLNRAFALCMAGAPLIAIGMNKYFKDEQGLKLDAGPFVKALEWAVDTQAIVMGKPDQAFFEQVVASTPFQAKECLMIGDDVLGDIVGAIDAGLQACLVMTGKYQKTDDQRMPVSARKIRSVAELFT